MKKYNKNNISLTLFSLLAVILMVSCDDWKEVETIDLDKADISKDNPELYAKYLENLHEYKKSNHVLVYAWAVSYTHLDVYKRQEEKISLKIKIIYTLLQTVSY